MKYLRARDGASLASVRAFLQAGNRVYQWQRRIWNDSEDAAILRLVLQGTLDDRLFDISDLSHAMDMHRDTVRQRVRGLEKDEWVKSVEVSRRRLICATDKLYDTIEKRALRVGETFDARTKEQ